MESSIIVLNLLYIKVNMQFCLSKTYMKYFKSWLKLIMSALNLTLSFLNIGKLCIKIDNSDIKIRMKDALQSLPGYIYFGERSE